MVQKCNASGSECWINGLDVARFGTIAAFVISADTNEHLPACRFIVFCYCITHTDVSADSRTVYSIPVFLLTSSGSHSLFVVVFISVCSTQSSDPYRSRDSASADSIKMANRRSAAGVTSGFNHTPTSRHRLRRRIKWLQIIRYCFGRHLGGIRQRSRTTRGWVFCKNLSSKFLMNYFCCRASWRTYPCTPDADKQDFTEISLR